MQTLEIDWQQFLDALPAFQQLPLEARRLFLEKVRPSQPISSFELGEYLEVLCAAGFLLPGVRGTNASVPPRYRDLCRVMRALYRHRVFDFPSRSTFHAYLVEHFTRGEQGALYGHGGDYYYGEQKLYLRVASREWLERFLAAPGDRGDNRHHDVGWDRQGAFPLEVLRATQELVRRLMGPASPVALTELRNLWPEGSPALLSPSLVAGMRYLLFFPALRGIHLEPVLGIWPSITKRLLRPAPKPPGTFTPHQVFEAPFLMDDMASILTACAADPFRIRSDDYALFARAAQGIASALGTLPEWVENQFNLKPSERLEWALAFSKQYEFLKEKGQHGKDLRLEVSEAGRNWLGLPVKDRLKTLLDGLLGKVKKRTELFDYEDGAASLLPYSFGIESMKQDHSVRSAMLAVYAGHDADSFMSLEEFLSFHSQQNNPLMVAAQNHPHAMLMIRGAYVPMPDPDELEEAWADLLRAFLRMRLLPLGAAKVGVDGEGATCFTLTEAGRYLVGAQADFRIEQAAVRIVVQPNFDVVFMGPAPWAEADIGRFAERKGRHMGTLFRITKRSIMAAAAAGLTGEWTFETLRQCCSGELPPNVRREISGWFSQCRRVSLRPAVLIHCPDPETAARVQAVAGSKVTLIADVILELHDQREQGALLRKLRDSGIFISP
ncbi:MAG: helicase-associated domain-containing protein [Terriglobia bacterium]|jgi:hypothetical protein